MQSSDSAYKTGYMVGQILGMGIGLLLVVALIVCLVMAIRRRTTGWIVGAAVSGLLVLGGIGVAVFAAVTGVVSAVAKADKIDQKLTSPDGKYSVTVPHGWKVMNELNKQAIIASGNPVREQYGILLTEPKAGFRGSIADYSTAAADYMSKSMQNAVVGGSEDVEVNGMKGRQCRIAGTAKGIEVVYLHTTFETPEHWCRLICWTLAPREKVAVPVFKNVVKTFTSGTGS